MQFFNNWMLSLIIKLLEHSILYLIDQTRLAQAINYIQGRNIIIHIYTRVYYVIIYNETRL